MTKLGLAAATARADVAEAVVAEGRKKKGILRSLFSRAVCVPGTCARAPWWLLCTVLRR